MCPPKKQDNLYTEDKKIISKMVVVIFYGFVEENISECLSILSIN